MSGSRCLLGFGAWLGWMLLAAGAELTTVAYVVDRVGFDEIGSEWRWQDISPPADLDWFRGDAEDGGPEEKFATPVRLEKRPTGSRFFAEGDRMWLLTGTLRQQKILKHERSWAVWNADRNRLVVHGTAREHGQLGVLWQDLTHVTLVETSVELVKVRCGEIAGVAWTAEEVRKRGGRVVHAVGATTRPGQRGTAAIGTEAGEVLLEVEPHTSYPGELVDVRLNYEAAVRHAEGVRTLTVNTGMTVLPGHTIYVEVGGADEAGETYLLGARSQATCMDGTPRWRWREFEDASIQVKPPEKLPGYFEKTALADGMILSRILVPPTFLRDSWDEDDRGDPFEPDESGADHRIKLRKLTEAMGISVVESLADVPECQATDLVFDLTDSMKKMGLMAPKGGWIYYNYTRSVLIATLDEEVTELLDALTAVIDGGQPKMIHGTVTLIEWEGELEPGKVPAGARRLARAGAVARPGQKVTVWHSGGEEALKRGVRLELEPNVGANGWILDARVKFEAAGERPSRLKTGLTMVDGDPVVLPLGEVDGKTLGVVVAGRVIDGTGAEVRR